MKAWWRACIINLRCPSCCIFLTPTDMWNANNMLHILLEKRGVYTVYVVVVLGLKCVCVCTQYTHNMCAWYTHVLCAWMINTFCVHRRAKHAKTKHADAHDIWHRKSLRFCALRLAAPEGRHGEVTRFQKRLRLRIAADLWNNGVPLEEAMALAEKAFGGNRAGPKGKGKGKGKAKSKGRG